MRDSYANRTALEIGAVLHGQGSRIASAVAESMQQVLIPEKTIAELLARARLSMTLSPIGEASVRAVGVGNADGDDDDEAHTAAGASDWAQDGTCATAEFAQGLTRGGESAALEFHGMPDAATLKRLTSSGRPVILRSAGQSLGLAPGLWSRADLLARFGNYSIPVGRGTNDDYGDGEEAADDEGTERVADYVALFARHGELSASTLGYSFVSVKGLQDNQFRAALEADFAPFHRFLGNLDPFRTLPPQVHRPRWRR